MSVKAVCFHLLTGVALLLGGCAMMADNRQQAAAMQAEVDTIGPAYRKKLAEAKPLIIIGHNAATSGRDNQVNAFIHFQNTSDKTIKYIRFYLTALNRVGDPVASTEEHPASIMLTATGPYAPGQINDPYERWTGIWRTPMVDFMRIDRVNVEFMDLTTQEIAGEALATIQVWPVNNDFAAGFQQKRRVTIENGRVFIRRLDLPR